MTQGLTGSTKIAKTVGWMNKHGNLSQQISFKDVAGPLMIAGDRKAGQLLHELEEAGETVRDPTAWLKAAATRGMGGYMPMMMAMGGMGASKKISKTVGWLNKNVE